MIQVFRPYYRVERCLQILREVLESGWTGQGPKCSKIEEDWKSFTGAQNALFVNSATAGLHIAVRLLNLPKGSKIATTPITFCSTNSAILYEDHSPIFCDINENDLSLSCDSVMSAIDQGADAVMWVHYAGNVSPEYEKFSFQGSQKVIEDCAHAAGAFYRNGKRVGSDPKTISVFSYQAVKNMPVSDAGMICCSTKEMDTLARKLGWMGIDKSTYARSSGDAATRELYKWKYTVDVLGWKYNGNDIMAAIALAQLEFLDQDNAYRRQLYRWYSDNFKNTNVRVIKHGDGSSVHLVAIRVNNREEVLGELKLKGIAPGVHYLPNYEFPIFAPFYKKGQCPVSEKISEQLLTLPTHLMLTKKDVDNISEIVVRTAK